MCTTHVFYYQVGGVNYRVEFATRELCQLMYDTMQAAGYYMVSARP